MGFSTGIALLNMREVLFNIREHAGSPNRWLCTNTALDTLVTVVVGSCKNCAPEARWDDYSLTMVNDTVLGRKLEEDREVWS